MKNLKVIERARDSQKYYSPDNIRLICWGYSPIEGGAFEIAGETYVKEICDIVECGLENKDHFIKMFSKQANSDYYKGTLYHYIDVEGIPATRPIEPPTFKETKDEAIAAVKNMLAHRDVETHCNYNSLFAILKTLESI